MKKEDTEKLDWEDIILNMNKPVWDEKMKRWRVLEGYKYYGGTHYIFFTDTTVWFEFNKRKLYLKEKEND